MRWSDSENATIRALLEPFLGCEKKVDWVQIARKLPGRSAKQCREHWNGSMNPNVNKSAFEEWEIMEVDRLISVHSTQWGKIAELLGNGRSDLSIRNMYYARERKAHRAAARIKKKTMGMADPVVPELGRTRSQTGQAHLSTSDASLNNSQHDHDDTSNDHSKDETLLFPEKVESVKSENDVSGVSAMSNVSESSRSKRSRVSVIPSRLRSDEVVENPHSEESRSVSAKRKAVVSRKSRTSFSAILSGQAPPLYFSTSDHFEGTPNILSSSPTMSQNLLDRELVSDISPKYPLNGSRSSLHPLSISAPQVPHNLNVNAHNYTPTSMMNFQSFPMVNIGYNTASFGSHNNLASSLPGNPGAPVNNTPTASFSMMMSNYAVNTPSLMQNFANQQMNYFPYSPFATSREDVDNHAEDCSTGVDLDPYQNQMVTPTGAVGGSSSKRSLPETPSSLYGGNSSFQMSNYPAIISGSNQSGSKNQVSSSNGSSTHLSSSYSTQNSSSLTTTTPYHHTPAVSQITSQSNYTSTNTQALASNCSSSVVTTPVASVSGNESLKAGTSAWKNSQLPPLQSASFGSHPNTQPPALPSTLSTFANSMQQQSQQSLPQILHIHTPIHSVYSPHGSPTYSPFHSHLHQSSNSYNFVQGFHGSGVNVHSSLGHHNNNITVAIGGSSNTTSSSVHSAGGITPTLVSPMASSVPGISGHGNSVVVASPSLQVPQSCNGGAVVSSSMAVTESVPEDKSSEVKSDSNLLIHSLADAASSMPLAVNGANSSTPCSSAGEPAGVAKQIADSHLSMNPQSQHNLNTLKNGSSLPNVQMPMNHMNHLPLNMPMPMSLPANMHMSMHMPMNMNLNMGMNPNGGHQSSGNIPSPLSQMTPIGVFSGSPSMHYPIYVPVNMSNMNMGLNQNSNGMAENSNGCIQYFEVSAQGVPPNFCVPIHSASQTPRADRMLSATSDSFGQRTMAFVTHSENCSPTFAGNSPSTATPSTTTSVSSTSISSSCIPGAVLASTPTLEGVPYSLHSGGSFGDSKSDSFQQQNFQAVLLGSVTDRSSIGGHVDGKAPGRTGINSEDVLLSNLNEDYVPLPGSVRDRFSAALTRSVSSEGGTKGINLPVLSLQRSSASVSSSTSVVVSNPISSSSSNNCA